MSVDEEKGGINDLEQEHLFCVKWRNYLAAMGGDERYRETPERQGRPSCAKLNGDKLSHETVVCSLSPRGKREYSRRGEKEGIRWKRGF